MSYSILDKLALSKTFLNLAQSEPALDLSAIGHVYVDYHSFIQDFSGIDYAPSMGPLKADLFDSLKNQNTIAKRSVGGGAANVAVTLSKFGLKTYFTGKSGNDDDGILARSYLSAHGVRTDKNAAEANSTTDKCLIFVLPDGERRIFGTSDEHNVLSSKDFEEAPRSRVTYIELSILHLPEARRALLEFIKEKEHEGIVACSLVSEGTAHRFSKEINALLQAGQIDILFGNEAEMMALENVKERGSLRSSLSTKSGMYVITQGREGALVLCNNNEDRISPHPPKNVVDTTGAGDQFAAGFIYGLCKGWDLEKTGKFAAVLSSQVIGHIGQDFDPLASFNEFHSNPSLSM